MYHDRFPLSGSFTTFGQRTDPEIDGWHQGITNANYSKRLDLGNEPEFKEIATLFNEMAERLAEYRNSSLEDILQGKKYIETIINSIAEPIIGLSKERKIFVCQ